MRLEGLLQGWLARAAPGGSRPIGLDLGDRALGIVQLGASGESFALKAAARIAYPSDRASLLASSDELRPFLRHALRAAGARGRRVVTAMPSDALKLMVLNYELSAADADAQAILGLVGERVREPLSQLVIDYLPFRTTGEKHGEKSALVAVAQRDLVIEHLERLRGCGLRVDALEIAPVAVRRLMSHLTRDETGETSVVIHCVDAHSTLLVVWGRRLILYRDVEFGVQQALDGVRQALDLPPDAAASVLERHGVATDGSDDDVSRALLDILKPVLYGLAEHINKAVVYTAAHTHGAAIERVYLLGTPTRWPGVGELLGRLLSLPVAPVDPLEAFRRRQGAPLLPARSVAELGVAAGLGLKERQADA